MHLHRQDLSGHFALSLLRPVRPTDLTPVRCVSRNLIRNRGADNEHATNRQVEVQWPAPRTPTAVRMTELCNIVADVGRVRRVLLRIAGGIDELARARIVQDEQAQVDRDLRAERPGV